MDDFYFFWNTFNLIAVLTVTIGLGLLIGGIFSIAVTMFTQVEDSSVAFFSKFVGCVLGVYLLSPFILSSLREFTERIWSGQDIFK